MATRSTVKSWPVASLKVSIHGWKLYICNEHLACMHRFILLLPITPVGITQKGHRKPCLFKVSHRAGMSFITSYFLVLPSEVNILKLVCLRLVKLFKKLMCNIIHVRNKNKLVLVWNFLYIFILIIFLQYFTLGLSGWYHSISTQLLDMFSLSTPISSNLLKLTAGRFKNCFCKLWLRCLLTNALRYSYCIFVLLILIKGELTWEFSPSNYSFWS